MNSLLESVNSRGYPVLKFWDSIYKEKYFLRTSKKTTQINLNVAIDATKINEMFSTKDGKNIGVIPEDSSLIDKFKGFENDVMKYHALIGLLIDHKMLISHCFILLTCPFGFMKPFLLHVYFTNSGVSSDEFPNRIDKIKSLNSNVFKVKMVSTDAV